MGIQSVADAGATQVAKQCYKNQTNGYISVVKLDHLGQQVGTPVEPHGTVYLTDDEALLTARAPRDPANNPFVEKEYTFLNSETHQHERHPMRPLVLITDPREMPSGGERGERFVPGSPLEDATVTPTSESVEAGRRDTQAALARQDDRPVGGEGYDPAPGPQSAGVFIRPGHLSGDAAPVQIDDADPVQLGAPTTEVATDLEETAGEITQTGEETGAADQPQAEAPQGEYAQHEEVATPEAPGEDGS